MHSIYIIYVLLFNFLKINFVCEINVNKREHGKNFFLIKHQVLISVIGSDTSEHVRDLLYNLQC